ncbi:MAG TPA: serine/threonine-protein kinase [Myxococcaceae bacterium]|nr:serine/threonine-protein kinase [Myxococcaceae bacterium]
MANAPPLDSHFFPEPGSLIGPWLLGDRIGQGSHGVVFSAVHADRPEAGSYALKLALMAGDERFEREATLLTRVQHPSVPRLEGRGLWLSPEDEAHPYLVMQRVEGLSLYAWAIEHELTVRDALGQLAQVARALEATHVHGVHRDVKGGNIRVSSEGHAVLLDFGSCFYPGASPLTGKALPPGTQLYRSPQLLTLEFALELGSSGTYEAQPVDDVYALGITAYRLLAGIYPPRDSDGTALPQAPRGLKDVCPELAELIVRMLAEDPKARGSAGQVAEKLERLMELSREVLDAPWVSDASRRATQKTKPPPPPPPPKAVRRVVAPLSALAGGGLMAALLGVLLTRDGDRREVASVEPLPKPQAREQPDAGTSLGEESLASVSPGEAPPTSKERISQKMPDKPLPKQKRPPCTGRAVLVINGGCWRPAPPEAELAPCDDDLYEYKGRCYDPILIKGERVPTSNEPQ